MLTEICQYLRNWFVRDKYIGAFSIADGEITDAAGDAPPLLDGQYYRIVGSVLNDGVHKYGDAEDVLTDEPTFDGAVWSMAVPPAVVALADEIEAWVEKYRDAINSPFQSESFGGYSYQLRSGTAAEGDYRGAVWQGQFGPMLSPWRKI